MNKFKGISKLSMEFLGYLFLSVATAVFSFAFLYYMSMSIAGKIVEKRTGDLNVISDVRFLSWLQAVCFVAALIIFLAFFLFFSGQKIVYILSITNAVEMFEGGRLDIEIPVKGEDELAELARGLNRFSQTLQQHMQGEEDMRRERHELVRSLSHDIRTPLTAIISYSDFIRTGRYDTNESLEAYASCIQEKAYRIQELAELLLNDEDVIQNVTALVNGKLLFEQMLSEFRDSLEGEGYTVRIKWFLEEDFEVRIVPQDMLRIFDNLYSNIIKYGDKAQEIEVELIINGEYLQLTQKNAVQKMRENQVKSYGIGLQNIRRIAKKYSGDITIDSGEERYQIEIQINRL